MWIQLSSEGLSRKAFSRVTSSVRDGFRVSVANPAEAARLIRENLALFRDFEVTKGKMDDIFLAVTGRKLGEEQ